VNQISKDDSEEIAVNQICGTTKENYSKIVVNIPKRLLRKDISVNVNVPDNDPCGRGDSDSENSEDNSTSGSLICTNSGLIYWKITIFSIQLKLDVCCIFLWFFFLGPQYTNI